MASSPLGSPSPSSSQQVQLTALPEDKVYTHMAYSGIRGTYSIQIDPQGETAIRTAAVGILAIVRTHSNSEIKGKLKEDNHHLSINWANPLEAKLTIIGTGGNPDEEIMINLQDQSSFETGIDLSETVEKIKKFMEEGKAAIEKNAAQFKGGAAILQEVNRRGLVNGSESFATSDVFSVRKGSVSLTYEALSPVIQAEVNKLPLDERKKFMVELNAMMLYQDAQREHFKRRIETIDAEITAAQEASETAVREHKDVEAKIKTVEAKISELGTAITAEEKNKKDLRDTIGHSEGIVSGYTTKYPSLSAAVPSDPGQLQEYKDFKAAEARLIALKAKKASSDEKLRKLKADKTVKEAELGTLKSDLIAKTEAVTTTKAAVERLIGSKEGYELAKQAHDEAKAKVDGATREISDLDKKIASIERKFEKLEKELVAARVTQTACQAAYDAVTPTPQTTDLLATDLVAARQAVIELEAEQTYLESELTTVISDKVSKRTKLEGLNTELATKKTAMDTAHEAIEKLEKPRKELSEALANLEGVDEFSLAWGLLYRNKPEQSLAALEGHMDSIRDPQKRWYNKLPRLGISTWDRDKLKAYSADCLSLWSENTWAREQLYQEHGTPMTDAGKSKAASLVDIMKVIVKKLEKRESLPSVSSDEFRELAKLAGVEDPSEIQKLHAALAKIDEQAREFKKHIETFDEKDFTESAFWDAFKAKRLTGYVSDKYLAGG